MAAEANKPWAEKEEIRPYDVYKEFINRWIKAELFMDFHVIGGRPVETEIDEYITFFNEQRSAYALHYLTPKQYQEIYAPWLVPMSTLSVLDCLMIFRVAVAGFLWHV